ncbi:UBX domain-containing protein 3 [Smittium mucronatum]|uniref:UBX domain-containing protein 3 n=1 Tax=Smittium mucronatum TaxID=133383 RepID=A0A1R0H1T1_9FUNG|nr:UBX domain-containing protein 3 [Smittium mucronatum]
MSGKEEKDRLIEEFLAINPIKKSDAQFFLEASNWDINLALSNSYDNKQIKDDSDSEYEEEINDGEISNSSPLIDAPQSSTQRRSNRLSEAKPKPTTSNLRSGNRIATLNYDSEDSEEKKQDWYTGGEKSGLNVLAPGSEGPDQDDLVQKLLKKAQQFLNFLFLFTFRQLPFDELPGGKRRSERNKGKRLINTIEDSESEDESPELETVTRTLHIWRNGFSIEDGALYSFDEPRSQSILEKLLQGHAPLDILDVKPGQPVEMLVSKKTDQDFVQQKAKLKPFQGKGSRLGNIGPSFVSSPSAEPISQQSSSVDKNPIVVNEDLPTTQVLVNLADGTRLKVKLNLTNTISDLKSMVVALTSNSSNNRDFTLKTTYPVKILTDLNQTIEDAKLSNSVVFQTLI